MCQKACLLQDYQSQAMLFVHWNTLNLFFKNCLFFFCILFLHDDGCLLLFYPDDPKVYWNFFAYFQQNNFKIFYKWIICILVLKLAQPSIPTKIITPFHYLPNIHVFHSRKVFLKMFFVVSNSSIQTMVSRLMFFMCSFFLANGIIRLLISFTFWILPSLVSSRVDVSSHDILFDDIDHNNILLGPDGVPWHGPKERCWFDVFFIKVCCVVSDLVANVIAGTCSVYVLFWFQCLLNFVFLCIGNMNV
jgi:hypothetical protein